MDSEEFSEFISDALSDVGSDLELEDGDNQLTPESNIDDNFGVLRYSSPADFVNSPRRFSRLERFVTSPSGISASPMSSISQSVRNHRSRSPISPMVENLVEKSQSPWRRFISNSPDPERNFEIEETDNSQSDSESDGRNWVDGDQFVTPDINFGPEPEPFIDLDLDSLSPLSILQKFLTKNVVDDIIYETNYYAESQTSTKWKKVDVNEFWIFFGLRCLTGLIKKNCIKDYWTTDPLLKTPIFNESMSKRRYLDILKCLHFNHSPPINPHDRMSKLGTIFPEIMKNVEKVINVGEHLCIDESLMKFKGRLGFKQYNPKKQAKFGIKIYELVDTKTKYLIRLQVYLGKKTPYLPAACVSKYGCGGATVITLLDGYMNKKHKVTVDNFFNSPILATYLLNHQTYILGTVNKRRKEMPKFTGKLKKGDVQCKTDSSILVERWEDRREVLMLNTYIPHSMQDSISSNPQNSREKPLSVLRYNKLMGAVDDIDRQMSPYDPARKTLKWYKKLALHIFDLIVYNSFVCSKSNKNITYMEFLKKFISEILQTYKLERVSAGRPRKLEKEKRFEGQHLPEKILKNGKSDNHNCHYCYNYRAKRSATHFKCMTCNVYLCIDNADSCYKIYHTIPRLPCINTYVQNK